MSLEEKVLDEIKESEVMNHNQSEVSNKNKWKKNSKKGKEPYKKRKSKLSTTIEKIFTSDNSNDSVSSDNNIETFTMISLTINLVINDVIKPIMILMSNTNNIEVLIKRAISEFNQSFASEGTLFRLADDHNLYGFKPSKKTGFPKSEMPSFNPKASIEETNCLEFTLIWKDNSSDYTIYFVKNKAKPKMSCKDCAIY